MAVELGKVDITFSSAYRKAQVLIDQYPPEWTSGDTFALFRWYSNRIGTLKYYHEHDIQTIVGINDGLCEENDRFRRTIDKLNTKLRQRDDKIRQMGEALKNFERIEREMLEKIASAEAKTKAVADKKPKTRETKADLLQRIEVLERRMNERPA